MTSIKTIFTEIINKYSEHDIKELIKKLESHVNKINIINDQVSQISAILRDNDKLNIPTKDILDIVDKNLKEYKKDDALVDGLMWDYRHNDGDY